MITVEVPIPGHRYDVLVGHGARHELAGLLPASAKRAAIVTQPGVPLELDPGIPFERFEIGVGEEHKSLATIEALCRGFARMGLTRHDVVIAHGGGIVTDVGGFAAAAWHRGVPVVHVTTTLLGMVDAAIGGKTAVNLPEGKNLVGAIWQPSGVICDLDALTTLPPRQWRCGRGEMAKYHFLTGDDLLALDEPERIARCVAIKAAVVAGDEREDPDGGARALLNYGHTLAHALEIATHHQLEHGEAVAIGLVYAAHLARLMDRIDDAAVQHHYDVVAGGYELDTALPAGLDPDELVALMGRDKKAVDSLTFVLDSPRGVEVVKGVDPAVAREALAVMAERRGAAMEAPHLPTARLLVRPWRDVDKPAYAALNADPDVMAHFPSTLTAEQSDEMVDRLVARWGEIGFGGWAVERLDTGEVAGMVMLASPSWSAWFTPCVEIGWRFARQHWGHGFAPEAAHAVVGWAFANVELPNDELVTFTTVQNVKSRRVMEKLGFTHDPADDFDHPLLEGWVEARHVIYRMSRQRWTSGAAD